MFCMSAVKYVAEHLVPYSGWHQPKYKLQISCTWRGSFSTISNRCADFSLGGTE
jgi:hypothetical protein